MVNNKHTLNGAIFSTIAQNIQELSNVAGIEGHDSFPEMPAEQRLQYINDLALGMIDLLDPRMGTGQTRLTH